MTNTATVATGTIKLPVNPVDGQAIELIFAGAVTTLTITPQGYKSIQGAATTAAANSHQTYEYFDILGAWYPI